MGKRLSDILSILENLQSLNFDSSIAGLQDYIKKANSYISDLDVINQDDLLFLEKNLQESIAAYHTNIKKIEQKLSTLVFNNKKDYVLASQKIWADNFEKMTFNEHLQWAPLWPPSSKEFEKFVEQIALHLNWKISGLILGAKNSEIIRTLTSTEPFYVVEQHTEYFKLQKEKFPVDFHRKMKCYNLNDLNLLPNKSIGVIVVYNEFPFLPWDTISQILHILVNKLNDGGVIIFNYNECTTVAGLDRFEKSHMCYSTSSMFDSFFVNHNMNCVKKYVSETETFSYLIYKKEGTTPLIKNYPSVGYIYHHPSFSNHEEHKEKIEYIRKLVAAKNAE